MTSRLLEPLTNLRRVLKLLRVSAGRISLLAGVLMLLEIGFAVLSLYLIKGLIDLIALGQGTTALVEDTRLVLWQVAALGGATLGFLIARALSGLATEAQGMAVADHVQGLIHARAIAADLAFYESPQYFDTLHRARQAGAERPAQVTGNLLQLSKNLLMMLAVVGLLISITPWLLPILLLAIVPALWVRLHFTRRLYEWRRERTPRERRANYLDWLLTSDVHAKEIRLFSLGRYFAQRHSELRRGLREESFRINRRRTAIELAVAVAAGLAFLLALGYLVLETAGGRNTIGDLALFLVVFQRAQNMGQQLVSQISRLYEDHLYLGQLFEFLDLEPRDASRHATALLEREGSAALELRDVSFSYPGSESAALKNVNLRVGSGQIVALVGANGSGKSTLLKLMTGLYEPSDGRILLDGQDVSAINPDAYRRAISGVFQDFSRFSDSVRQNIAFGDIDASRSAEDIQQAARQAGADGFIETLPAGYETLLGRVFEGGRDVSMGQWQRLALARALLAPSRILLLDEPASALDQAAEIALFAAIRQQASSRSALIITHRLSLARHADHIYELADGMIIASGGHEELLQLSKPYRDAFKRQRAESAFDEGA